jgi:hypothetical protein
LKERFINELEIGPPNRVILKYIDLILTKNKYTNKCYLSMENGFLGSYFQIVAVDGSYKFVVW